MSDQFQNIKVEEALQKLNKFLKGTPRNSFYSSGRKIELFGDESLSIQIIKDIIQGKVWFTVTSMEAVPLSDLVLFAHGQEPKMLYGSRRLSQGDKNPFEYWVVLYEMPVAPIAFSLRRIPQLN